MLWPGYLYPINPRLMQFTEIEKSKAYIQAELVEYVPHSAVFRTLIRKITGNIVALAIDGGEKLEEKISPFDAFIEIIEGKSEIIIDNHSNIPVQKISCTRFDQNGAKFRYLSPLSPFPSSIYSL